MENYAPRTDIPLVVPYAKAQYEYAAAQRLAKFDLRST